MAAMPENVNLSWTVFVLHVKLHLILMASASARKPQGIIQKLKKSPAVAWDIAQTFPKVLRVIWLLKKYPDLPSLLQVVTPQQINASKTTPSTERLVRGVGWSTRLLRFRPEGTCLLRSLTLFSELRSRGQKAFFVSGVRKDPGGIKGHAWVELDGKALKGFGDENARELYKISIIHPQST